MHMSSCGHCTSSRGSKYNRCVGSRRPDHWTRASDIQYYACSMKNLNNFQNALISDFELLHIEVLIYCILSKVSINSRI